MATGTLSPDPWLTVLDGNGNPVSGAKIYTYVAGTTTLVATYTDVALSVPNTNPIIADSAGRYVAFLSPGASYKFIVQNADGSALRTQDNISAVPATSSNIDISGVAGENITAGEGVYLSDGSGGKVAGQWYGWDATNTYSSITPEVGIAPAAISSGASGTIRLGGQATGLTSLTVGSTYYIGSAGAVTSTAPTTNRRPIGVADSTSTIIFGTVAFALIATTTAVGTQNDFAPGIATAPNTSATILRCNNASLLTITGLAGGVDGQRLIIESVGAGQVDLTAQSTGSVAGNRLLNFAGNSSSIATSLAAGAGMAEYVYDASASRWRLVSHEQGAWITRAFAAGNYTASSSTWTVASATTDAYYLRGRTLLFSEEVTGTLGGTPASVSIALPNGFVSAKAMSNVALISNGGTVSAGQYAVTAAGTTIAVLPIGGTWGTSALVNVTLALEVQ